MKQTVTSIDGADQKKMYITAFSAVKQEYGLKIEVIGCVKLCPTRSTSESVIGIVELDDQVVPILDSRKETTAEITNLCCIVILENLIGDTTILTGRLYESSSQVFDLVVECMDSTIPSHSTQEDTVGSEKDTVSPSTLLQYRTIFYTKYQVFLITVTDLQYQEMKFWGLKSEGVHYSIS